MKEKKEIVERDKISKSYNKNEKGITLIVLVITIIIIIILSSVTINATFGDSGLIIQAQVARDLTINSIAYEQERLANLIADFEKIIRDSSEITYPDDDYQEDDDGETYPDGWDLDKVTPVKSADDVVVPVPKGYTASDVEGENTVAGGFVIYEGEDTVSTDEDAETTRNQFVWIPVDDIRDIANEASQDSSGTYQGKLYDFSEDGATEKSDYGQGTTSYREPDIVTGTGGRYDASYANYFSVLGLTSSSAFLTQLQNGFDEMIESIKTYGGFYIGRYETGELQENKNAEPVVVKGNSEIANVNWYYIYQNSKLVAANDDVVTTMIWGCLWDRTLIWLTETDTKTYDEIVDSSSWGNYNSSIIRTTGYNEIWKANNIYDLAGNVTEWTIEAGSNSSRVFRGGSSSSGGSVSYRSYNTPTLDFANVRVASSTLY